MVKGASEFRPDFAPGKLRGARHRVKERMRRLAEAPRGCPEMGTRAAARTVAKPFPFTKVPVFWGFWQSGGRRLVVHLAKTEFRDSLLDLWETGGLLLA
jgi:hypothetical protein